MASKYIIKDRTTHAEHGANRPDHWMNLAHLPYFIYATRQEAETYLGQSIGRYIIRNCNDPAEFIDGAPNPNLFVLSYREPEPLDPGSYVFRHVKFLRVPQKGLTLSNRVNQSSVFFPSLKEMLANSSIYYITPFIKLVENKNEDENLPSETGKMI